MPRKRSNLLSFEMAVGMSVYIVKSMTDETTHDIIYLNIVGSRAACRATMAVLKSRQTNNWQLCDHPVRLQKLPGHHQIITELPNGQFDYLWISYQAIPKRIQPDMPGFVWRTDNNEDVSKPPAHFYDVFQSVMSFPSRPEWADMLWDYGINANLIRPISSRNSNDMQGYTVRANDPAWEHIIKECFLKGEMSLIDGHRVLRIAPTSDEILDAIKFKRFELGEIVLTPEVNDMLVKHNIDIIPYFERYAEGDWGDMSWQDKNTNNSAVRMNNQIKGVYKMWNTKEDVKVGIMHLITEGNRALTTARLTTEETQDGETR